jgi:hypothetical protein
MERHYDIFEILPDGAPVWRTAVEGHERALLKLRELAAQTTNEIRVMHLASNSIVATMNISQRD